MIILKILLYPIGFVLRLALMFLPLFFVGAFGLYLVLPFCLIVIVLGPIGAILLAIVTMKIENTGLYLENVFEFARECLGGYFSFLGSMLMWIVRPR